jgi:DNA-directed RNA polymerase sigma subunit (sigma70/sigma32)
VRIASGPQSAWTTIPATQKGAVRCPVGRCRRHRWFAMLDAKGRRWCRGPAARERLVLDNDRLACSLAWKFRWSGEDIEDLRQVAREALIVAAQRFDPSQGARFGTYASRSFGAA